MAGYKVTRLINKVNYRKEQAIAEKIQGKSRLFWKYVRQKTKTVSNISSLEINGKIITHETEIAEE